MTNVNRVPLIERIPTGLRNRAAYTIARTGLADRIIDRALHLGAHQQFPDGEPRPDRMPLMEHVPDGLRNRAAFALARLGIADRFIDKALHLKGPEATAQGQTEFWSPSELTGLPAGAVLGANGWESAPFAVDHTDSRGQGGVLTAPLVLPAGAVLTANGWESAYVPGAVRGTDGAAASPTEPVSVLPVGGVIQ